MLDFLKLGLLVSQISAETLVDNSLTDGGAALSEALLVFARQCQDDSAFAARLAANAPWILWPTAMPLEPLATVQNVPLLQAAVTPWTVVGVDGSQIMPSHHEVHNCYLLNLGLTRISYGLDLPPLLTSEPRLFARPEDLYPLVDRRRVYIDELYVSLERSLFELENLTSQAIEARRLTGVSVLAMYDGSLIPWSAEKMSEPYLQNYLGRFEACLDRLREEKVALVGYLSKSRASDTVNDLRSALCPYTVANCREHCAHLNEEFFPCSRVWPLADRPLYDAILQKGQRSCAMVSGASVVKSMSSQNAISFCYLKSEVEVARIEFPRWLTADPGLFAFALSGALTQVVKGQGYPLALSEAHHLAVIKGPERERFFEMLGHKMIQLGINKVATSPKEARKRKGFV
ncbi:MAG: DNA double-strand break repair nuclease NurA [Cyanobacteria bacterium REEB67]|nr:DNA double-strand break repair nuclease NurA [Cyanobacteria bacterium REEB67]